MENRIFFVRHGMYDLYTDHLNDRGQEQARAAREILLSEGIGRTALIISSAALRAVETAEILHEAIGQEIIADEKIETAGFAGNKIDDLEGLLTQVAGVESFSALTANGLVVVTHAPLVAAIKGPGVSEDDIVYGEVVKYQPGSWTPPPPSRYDGPKISLDDILKHGPRTFPFLGKLTTD